MQFAVKQTAGATMALFGQKEWYFENSIDYLHPCIIGWNLQCDLCFPPVAMPQVASDHHCTQTSQLIREL